MRVEVLMPKMGESITEGRILKWLKKPGDAVQRDDSIVEISTDKVDTEVPCPESGILVELLAQENDTIEVNKPIAIVETNAAEARPVTETKAAPNVATQPIQHVAPVVSAPEAIAIPIIETPPPLHVAEPPRYETSHSAGAASEKFFSPVVMRIASSEGIGLVELEAITGTGINGRVTKNDVLAYIEKKKTGAATVRVAPPQSRSEERTMSTSVVAHESTAPAPTSTFIAPGAEIIPMDNMHRIMAEHMVRSKQTSPHVTLVSECDVTKIAQFRARHAESFKTREGMTLTFMPFIADAAIKALKDFPFVNASIEGTNIILKKQINLGIAVALETGGLIVPVIKGADMLNLVGLARGITDLATRARRKKLAPDEIQDGTFTITNYGVFGNLFGTPIINQPQVAILGVGAVQKKPVVIESDGADSIAIRSMLYISLSFDHRLIDGALGGMYIERVVKYLEEFNLTTL